jgi:type I restriction-modification system DNA methylase subunit
LEPLINDEIIDVMDSKYYEIEEKQIELLRWSRLIELGNDMTQNDKNLTFIWKELLCNYPPFGGIFKQNKCFNSNPKVLFKCVYEINKITLDDLSQIKTDINGEIYERFVNKYLNNGGKALGQYFTKRSFINVISKLLDLDTDGKYMSAWDPAMGTGGMLKVIKILIPDINIFGNEIEPDTYIYGLMNSVLSNPNQLLNLKNKSSLYDIEPDVKYDLILTNPPFGTDIKYDDVFNDFHRAYYSTLSKKQAMVEFKKIIPYKTNKGESIFLQLCLYKLNIGGKCTIVLPRGEMLFGQKSHLNVRKYILKHFILEKILYAPKNTFEHTSIETCVLFISNDMKSRQCKEIEFWSTEADCAEWKLDGKMTYAEMHNFGYNFNYNKYLEYKKISQKLQSDYKNCEIKTMGEICKFLTKSKRKASFGENEGKYPFFTSSYTVKKCNIADYKTRTLIIGTGGVANIKIATEFSCSADNILCYSKYPDMVSTDYIYHYLYNNIDVLQAKFAGVSIKHITKTGLQQVLIPIPSIEKQNNIMSECIRLIDINNEKIKNLQNQISEIEKENKLIFKKMF